MLYVIAIMVHHSIIFLHSKTNQGIVFFHSNSIVGHSDSIVFRYPSWEILFEVHHGGMLKVNCPEIWGHSLIYPRKGRAFERVSLLRGSGF